MKVSIGQIYIKPGVSFPFSHLMQRWLAKELSSAASDIAEFEKKHGIGFSLMVNVSADTQLMDNQIKGPAVFKRDKDVQFTLFLPFDVIAAAPDGCRVAMEYLLSGIRSIFQKAGIDPGKLDEKRTFIIDHICADPTMLTEPWPNK
ncbi:hypothetical protein [Pyxidicoccus xibeiensis]|uniref:hypothetical protein n=1 Tax=Pyxidicoccus xibeiensis TaxID=2906759 RepID=UPI0020A80185|nr:hypothetical protein [Pyxidicoccus xibeiensis]MCP3140660.1 hypothetical protein [Pyxidicoccus xibeiensis]